MSEGRQKGNPSHTQKSFSRALGSQQKRKTMDHLSFFNVTCTSLMLKKSEAEKHSAFRITRRRLERAADMFTIGS